MNKQKIITIIWASALGLVILALIIALLRSRSKKDKKPKPEVKPDPAVTDDNGTDEQEIETDEPLIMASNGKVVIKGITYTLQMKYIVWITINVENIRMLGNGGAMVKGSAKGTTLESEVGSATINNMIAKAGNQEITGDFPYDGDTYPYKLTKI